jgi:hypothetical protein
MIKSRIAYIFYFFFYLFFQVLLLKRLVLFNTSFCFLYVAFILLFSVEISNLSLMLIAFILGFSIDIFYDSMGIHAMAMVAIAYVRNYWLSSITPQGGYDSGEGPTLAINGLQWFLVYIIPLVFLHHAILFFVEAGGFTGFWFTMLKVIGSSLFTVFMILLFQYLNVDRR